MPDTIRVVAPVTIETGEQALLHLDRVHRALCVPWDSSSDTLEEIAGILEHAGYTLMDEETARAVDFMGFRRLPLDDERVVAVLDQYRNPSPLRPQGENPWP